MRKQMKRALCIVVALLLMLSLAGLAQDKNASGLPERKLFQRIKVDVVVIGEDGQPIPRIRVHASGVGLGVRDTLTNIEGRCGFELRPGKWTIRVSKVPSKVLYKEVIDVGFEKEMALVLNLAPQQPATDQLPNTNRLAQLQEDGVIQQITADSLDTMGQKAAVELMEFTETVLKQARHKIIDQYAAQDFSTSYWVTENTGSPVVNAPSQRLEVDWQGNLNKPATASKKASVRDILSGGSVMDDIPVNVSIDVQASRGYSGDYDFGLGYNIGNESNYPSLNGPGNSDQTPSFMPNISDIGRFLTGGSESPSEDLGYDLSLNNSLRATGDSSFRAFYREINNHVAYLYRPLRRAYLAKAAIPSSDVRAVEFGVQKTFLGGLKATVRYNYSEAGGLSIRTVDLDFEDWEDFESFLEHGLRHDLSTNLEATFEPSGTAITIGYKMFISDVPDLSIDSKISNLITEHSRIDIKLQQRLNFGILSSARISFKLAVNNLLSNRRNSHLATTDIERDLGARKVLGGIRIEF
jgi:hypothetical protein